MDRQGAEAAPPLVVRAKRYLCTEGRKTEVGFNIYDVRENKDTRNFYGHEIVIDGERGREVYPGKWDTSEAKRHYMDGVPWYVPLQNVHTCTVRIDGKYYALGHDLFMTTIYAIGEDRLRNSVEGKPIVTYYIGRGNEARNEAIKAVCRPHDYLTASAIARNSGIYDGQLYER